MTSPKADVIIIPGYQLLAPEKPPSILLSRIHTGIQLFHRDAAPAILVTGGIKKFEPPEAEIMSAIALAQKIPKISLFKEDASRSTFENALNCQPIIAKNHWKSAYIVSSPQHLKRCGMVFKLIGLKNIYLIPTVDDTYSRWERHKEFLACLYYRAKLWRYKSKFCSTPATVQTLQSAKHNKLHRCDST